MPATSNPDLRRSVRTGGFTLVETALAVAVVAFAFVALMALIPVGLTTFRRSIDTAVCAQIAQRVINDAQETDFDTLIDQTNLERSVVLEGFTFRGPRIGAPGLRYFDDQGMEVVPVNPRTLSPAESARIIYYVGTRIMPRTPLPKSGGPATSTNGSPHPEALALLTIQVAHNPGHFTLAFSSAAPGDLNSPGRNLFDTKIPSMRGIDVLTYCALVGRNL